MKGLFWLGALALSLLAWGVLAYGLHGAAILLGWATL